jgi:DNA-binding FadR family transcriptional regulator
MIEQVPRHPLAAVAARQLLERIREGEWPLGHKLPGETTLAAQMGIGRSTVREAIRELAGKGVLASRQGAGVFVTALDVEEGWDDMLGRADIAGVIEARIAIETEAARLAAVRRTPADIRVLRRAQGMRDAASAGTGTGMTGAEREAYVDADMALHRAVIVAAHNEVLLELFDAFVPRVRAAMIDLLRAHTVAPSDDVEGHDGLVEAVVARDAERAARTSRTHLTALADAFR